MQFSHTILVSLVLWVAVPSVWAAGDDPELKRIEGRFERTFRGPTGANWRTLREIRGAQSTVTTYDDQGKIVAAHTSIVRVEKRGPVRVLTFANSTVIAGPRPGAVHPGPSSYIYRLEGDTFTEVWGLLEEDPSPVRMISWRRIAEQQ